jgi:succinate dehydrogenase/fumarate reductase-like Fe-S protein
MSERQVELEVLRYNPETDREPHFQRYSIACREEWVVLDALNLVKETSIRRFPTAGRATWRCAAAAA